MNEPITVEAHSDSYGRLTPEAFVWRGRRYQILSHGRRWMQDDEQRFLVMVPGDKPFELAFLTGQGRWELRRTPRHFGGHFEAA